MKLSIALTAYNHVDYLAECLDSILTQECDFDFDVLVADDCSPDGTGEIARSYAARYPNVIKIVDRPDNIGYTRNLSDTLLRCTGEYIAIFDGDDIMRPGKLQAQVAFLDANPDVVLVGHLCREFDTRTGETRRWIRPPRIRERYSAEDQFRWSSFLANSSKMFRRSAMPTWGIDPRLKVVADWPLTVDIATQGSIGYIDTWYSDYRVHSGSIMRTATAWQHHLDYELIISEVQRRYPERFRTTLSRPRAYSQLMKGVALEGEGRTAPAAAAYRRAVRLDPTWLPAWRRSVLTTARAVADRRPRVGPRDSTRPLHVMQLSHTVFPDDFVHVVAGHLGRDPRFVSHVTTMDADMRDHGIDFAKDSIIHHCLGGNKRLRVPLYALRVARLVRQHRIDILHVHHYYEALIGALAVRMLSPRPILVVGRHYSDKLHEIEPPAKRWVFLTAERFAARSADMIVVPSSMVARIVHEDDPGVRQLAELPYPMLKAKYDSPGSLADLSPLPESGVLIGTFARLSPEKGHRFLLAAVAELVREGFDVHVLVVGDGPHLDQLSAGTRDLGIEDRVRFLGWRSDVLALMRRCDVIVQPTTTEAFSQAMAEALWMARPLIISDVSGARDLLGDSEYGIVVPPADVPSLTSAIRRLLTDPGERVVLGRAGRQRVESFTSADRVVPQFVDLYLSLAAATTESVGRSRSN